MKQNGDGINAADQGSAASSKLAAPSGRGFIHLLEAFRATGGTVPGEVVAEMLDLHEAGHAVSLAQLIYTGSVFGFEWRTSLWIPMFQFSSDDLALQADAQRVRAELPPMWSGWAVASWFALPSTALEGRCPVDMVHSDLEAVMRTARSPTFPEFIRPALVEAPCTHDVALLA